MICHCQTCRALHHRSLTYRGPSYCTYLPYLPVGQLGQSGQLGSGQLGSGQLGSGQLGQSGYFCGGLLVLSDLSLAAVGLLSQAKTRAPTPTSLAEKQLLVPSRLLNSLPLPLSYFPTPNILHPTSSLQSSPFPSSKAHKVPQCSSRIHVPSPCAS
jgi:hypothetical protein